LFATEAASSPRGESPWPPYFFYQCDELVMVNDVVADEERLKTSKANSRAVSGSAEV
jgi:hypothetical protein